MCLICTDLSKGLITPKDARRNALEMSTQIPLDHLLEVMKQIERLEDEQD